MKINPETTLRELAFLVCTALDQEGYIAVLTGGSAATIYAPDAYQSSDLDFVFTFWSSLGGVSEQALLALGFTRAGDFYKHPSSAYTLDFPRGPLAVGSQMIDDWLTMTDGDRVLYILTPTDSVRDRLCAYYFYNDFSGLEQALAVASRQTIDIEVVRNWSQREGELAKFTNFEARLRGR